MKLLNIKIENDNNDNFFQNFSFEFDNKNENDAKLLNIGKMYYASLINMVKTLLDISKIKKENNVIDYFIDEKKFLCVFLNLAENIKCKCFYRFFLLLYIKSIIVIDKNTKIPNIELDKIINN